MDEDRGRREESVGAFRGDDGVAPASQSKWRQRLFAVALGVLLLGGVLGRFAKRDAPGGSASANEKRAGGVTIQPVSPSQEVDRALASSRDLLRDRRAEESLLPLARALKLQPDNAAVHNNLCVAYGQLGQKERAIAACRRALELQPSFERARNNLRWVSSLDTTTDVRGPSDAIGVE